MSRVWKLSLALLALAWTQPATAALTCPRPLMPSADILSFSASAHREQYASFIRLLAPRLNWTLGQRPELAALLPGRIRIIEMPSPSPGDARVLARRDDAFSQLVQQRNLAQDYFKQSGALQIYRFTTLADAKVNVDVILGPYQGGLHGVVAVYTPGFDANEAARGIDQYAAALLYALLTAARENGCAEQAAKLSDSLTELLSGLRADAPTPSVEAFTDTLRKAMSEPLP